MVAIPWGFKSLHPHQNPECFCIRDFFVLLSTDFALSGRFFESEWRIVEREEVRNKEQTHHTNKAPAPGKMHELPQIVRTVQSLKSMLMMSATTPYGRVRMFQALTLKRPDGIPIPSERTVYRVMEKIGLSHRPKRNPKGVTKADREARKSDDLLKRNFTSEKPLEKCVTDITEIKAKDGKLYVSAIFDCFDSAVLGLEMETTMKATLCQHTVKNAFIAYPEIRGAVLHSDRGSQYTSSFTAAPLRKYEIIQSMNSADGRCHDNVRCESMWPRLKTELLYDRYNSENLTVFELKNF